MTGNWPISTKHGRNENFNLGPFFPSTAGLALAVMVAGSGA
jgi:hypothetical protein